MFKALDLAIQTPEKISRDNQMYLQIYDDETLKVIYVPK